MSGSSDITFRDVVETNTRLVYNTALHFLRQVEDAEDVTQEVFIEVHRSLSRFHQNSQLSTWIYRITVNKCLDHIRKKKRQKIFGFISSLFNDDTGELKHDKGHFDHPGILLENKEKARFLFEALDKLNENQRTAFVLFHLENLSQKEVAEIMELSPKAVESLIQRAKHALKLKLEKIYNKRGI